MTTGTHNPYFQVGLDVFGQRCLVLGGQDEAADKVESTRLAQIAIDARTQHLSSLDDAARALKRVLDSDREDQMVLDKTAVQSHVIHRRL